METLKHCYATGRGGGAGDQVLAGHIKPSGGSALYISPLIQNELIAIIGKQINDGIVQAVNKSRFFSFLADGTTDGTLTEQFSPCVGYVGLETMDIKKDFLAFVPVDQIWWKR
ncbi:hypothetical protein HPB48_014693 [Haemaphysalis longicornis]|uniref:DUF4371 domain-containing protein n=1 Tax=Haemaphysalis longicornis TaxID=44386 RepID=A0A9J6GTF0_HAELO|nr:hypothetical protein HPB48_014693 [Haemaphysalis longicornis]